jgi:hypothetical protein
MTKENIQHCNLRSGFSLTEALVATCIFLILVNMAFITLNTGVNSWLTGGTAVEVRSEIIKAFMVMEKDLKKTTSSGTSVCALDLDSDSTDTSISFPLPAVSNSTGAILDSLGAINWAECITYELNSSGEILRKTASGGEVVIARQINSLQFTRPEGSANLIQVDITAQKTDNHGRVVSDSGQITVKMRN